MGPKQRKVQTLTIADLPEAERSKVSRLVERLVTLGTEHQDTVDKLSALEAKSAEATSNAQKEIDEVRFSNAKDTQRLNDIIAALENQRASAFDMLEQYQTRLEQMAEVMRRKEADEISGERKVALLNNLSQLEAVVGNQKEMIANFERDRESSEKAHQEALALSAEALRKKEEEILRKQDSVKKAEKRCAAIEMACSRLTKQITEMTRRENVKQAEMDALKRLLSSSTSTTVVAAAHVEPENVESKELPLANGVTESDAKPVYDQAVVQNMPPKVPKKAVSPGRRSKESKEGHTPPHSPASSRSGGRAATASPKRKLSTAIAESRQTETSTKGGNASESILNKESPPRSTRSQQSNDAPNNSTISSPASRNSKTSRERKKRHHPVVVNHGMHKSSPTAAPRATTAAVNDKALQASFSKLHSSTTVASRAQQAQNPSKSSGSTNSSSRGDTDSVGSTQKTKKKEVAKSLKLIAGSATAAAFTAGSYARAFGSSPLKSRPKLEKLLGEEKLYDPVLLDLLNAIEN